MSAEGLISAYGDTYDAIRLGTAEQGAQLWLELGGPDEQRAAAAAEALEELTNDANRAAGQLVDEYVDTYVGAVSRRPPPSRAGEDALNLAELTVDQLRGVGDTFRRPAIATRAGLAQGKPFDAVMREQANRVNAQIQADIGLAHRQAGQTAMRRNGLDYYRRVLTGASCDLCRVASTQRYRTGDLMPIHSRCDCRIGPIVDGYDGGQIVNRDLYRQLKADGTLDRLNRSNRGRSGQARRASADANRAGAGRRAGNRRRQGRLDLEQPTLDIPPIEAPTVRTHGELGPVLVNERHAFTAARQADGVVEDAGDLRRRTPEVDVDDAPPARPPDPPKETPVRPERSGQFSPTSASVQRAAIRRNVSPEDIIDELELKRLDRLEQQKLARQAAKDLDDPTSAVVREAADDWGVTPDEFVAARAKVPEARRAVADAATKAQLNAFEQLDGWEMTALPRPPAVGARSPDGRLLRGGEWDWLETLSPEETKRLRRTWLRSDVNLELDDMVATMQARLADDLSIDEAMKRWLRENRTYEAAGAIRRGKLPSSRAYGGAVDVDNIVDSYLPADMRLRPSEVTGIDDIDVAGRLAQLSREADIEDASFYLEDALAGRTGDPPPWRMSFQSFEAELRELEYGIRNYPAEVRGDAADRLAELVPKYLDDPGTSYEELYSRVVDTARRSGQDVAEWARVPWDNVDLDDIIDDVVRQAELDEVDARRRLADRLDRFDREAVDASATLDRSLGGIQ